MTQRSRGEWSHKILNPTHNQTNPQSTNNTREEEEVGLRHKESKQQQPQYYHVLFLCFMLSHAIKNKCSIQQQKVLDHRKCTGGRAVTFYSQFQQVFKRGQKNELFSPPCSYRISKFTAYKCKRLGSLLRGVSVNCTVTVWQSCCSVC